MYSEKIVLLGRSSTLPEKDIGSMKMKWVIIPFRLSEFIVPNQFVIRLEEITIVEFPLEILDK